MLELRLTSVAVPFSPCLFRSPSWWSGERLEIHNISDQLGPLEVNLLFRCDFRQDGGDLFVDWGSRFVDQGGASMMTISELGLPKTCERAITDQADQT